MKKRILAGLLSALMLVTSVNVPVFAKDGEYDSFGTACDIQANVPVENNLGSYKDVDNYKFTFEADGVLTVNLMNAVADADVGWGWKVEIKDAYGNMICSREKITTKDTFGQLPYKKGTVLYISVRNHYEHVNFDTNSSNYILTAGYVATSNWETESNDKMSTAETMLENTEYHGDMYNESDKDYFKLVMQNDGVVSFNLRPSEPDTDKKWGWKLQICDADGNELKLLDKIKTNTSTGEMAFAKGTVLYVRVSNDYEHVNFAPAFEEYILTANVDTAKVSNWETELNNSKKTADKITFGKTIYGTMINTADEDYYKVSASADGVLAVTLKSNDDNDQQALGWGWKVFLYDANGNEVANGKMDKVKTKETFSVNVKKGTYYVKVLSSWNNDSPVDAVYGLTVDLITKVADKNITVPTIKDKKATVKWKKVNNVSGYELRWSSNKDMKSSKSAKVASSKTSYTITGLKAKTTYYVQIRAYKKTASGKTVYGSWSSKKTVKGK